MCAGALPAGVLSLGRLVQAEKPTQECFSGYARIIPLNCTDASNNNFNSNCNDYSSAPPRWLLADSLSPPCLCSALHEASRDWVHANPFPWQEAVMHKRRKLSSVNGRTAAAGSVPSR